VRQQTYSITSSAAASSIGGTSRPSALAVFRLMISYRQERCRIELADDGFDIAETSRQRLKRYDIAIAGRRQVTGSVPI